MKLDVALPLEPQLLSAVRPSIPSVPPISVATETAIAAAFLLLVPPVPSGPIPGPISEVLNTLSFTPQANEGFVISIVGVPIGAITPPAGVPYAGATIVAENR